VVLAVFRSARARRRLLWVGGLVTVAAAVAITIALLPSSAKRPPIHAAPNGTAQVVRVERDVPMTPARRRAIGTLIDAFVPSAVERRAPLRALPLVTPAFRAGVTRADWARGTLPVLPYDTRGSHFPWTLGYSHPREISVDVLLHPAPAEELGPIAFTAVFARRGKRWLIDSFVPAASFAPRKKAPRILAQPDFAPSMTTLATRGRLDARWLLVPGALLSLIVLVPVGIGVAHWRRARRAMREYKASYSR
jgi:hypothetical protein